MLKWRVTLDRHEGETMNQLRQLFSTTPQLGVGSNSFGPSEGKAA
jgi:hypothetical protein